MVGLDIGRMGVWMRNMVLIDSSYQDADKKK